MEERGKRREAEREAIDKIMAPIIDTTKGEVSIQLNDHQTGTVLDSPQQPLMWSLLITKGFAGPNHDIPGWTMQGQFNEVVCFLNGFQTCLMLLAAMVKQPTIITPDQTT